MRMLHIMSRLAEVDGEPPRGLVTLAQAQALLGDEVVIVPRSGGGKMVMEPGHYGTLTIINSLSDSSLKLPDKGVRDTKVCRMFALRK
jgi:hypothetical protein